MLKPIRAALFLCILMFGLQAIAQQNISEGIISYTELKDPNNSYVDVFASSEPLTFSFSDKMFRMDREGFWSATTYKPSGNPGNGHIIEGSLTAETKIITAPLEEDFAKAMMGIDIGKFTTISYNRKDTKTILGYDCYRANLVLADGSKQVYYITEKIKAPGYKHKGQSANIEGYPLEIQTYLNNELFRVFRAVKIKRGLPEDRFNLPAGKLVKEPMHKKNAVKDKLPQIKTDTPFVFKTTVLKELFDIAWALNETNMNAVMLAGAYKLKPEPDNKIVYTYQHEKKRTVYIGTENSDTAYIHILKSFAISMEVESILDDFESNNIVFVNEQKGKTTTSYYFTKENTPYMFVYQEGDLLSTFLYLYKIMEKK